MTRVLILYYSSYGHVEAMARAVAEGVRRAGGQPAVKRVPELVPEDVARAAGYRLGQQAPIAQVDELADYDAIVIGTPTRFGLMAAQMKNFLDRAGGLWARDALVGKVGSVFTSAATQHGGQEMTILSAHVPLLHFGMVVVGLPYTFKGQNDLKQITGCSPYGASAVAFDDRPPSDNELAGARFQGEHVTRIAARLTQGAAAEWR